MFKKKLSVGLILLLLFVLAGCRAGGMEKDVVYSQNQKPAAETENAAVSIQQAEAVEKAEAAFGKYLNIENIDKNLALKADLIEDDGVLWMNPYWKLSWMGKNAEKPVYSANIDAQTGEVVQLRYHPKWVYRNISKEDVLAYQDTALTFIDKFALVKDASLNIFDAFSSKMEGVCVEFRYGTDKFIMVYFNEAGEVEGFEFTQQVAYSLQGSDLKVDRAEAITMAKAGIKQYFGEVDTRGLIEEVQLAEGKNGERIWFVSWKNIALLEDKHVRYGAHIDALGGKLRAVEGVNSSLNKTVPEINKNDEEEIREIADRFLQQKKMSDYRFETFVKELGAPRYRNKAGATLHVFVDKWSGEVCFLSFEKFFEEYK